MVKIFNIINKRKIFSILLIGIVAILTISLLGSISAADQTITNTTSGGLEVAIDKVNAGETVFMENGIYKDGASINKDITIQGKGNNVVLDAQGGTIFRTGSSNVNLINLKLINGGGAYGPAIYASWGRLNLINCTFMNNSNNVGGGAIMVYGSVVTMDGCIFDNNRAEEGGAISCWNGASITMNNCIFNNNSAKIGGAIYIEYYNRACSVVINNCVFNDNLAFLYSYSNSMGFGGAIYNERGSLNITGSTFTNNEAYDYGAAIYNFNGTVRITNSKFNDNFHQKCSVRNAYSNEGGSIRLFGNVIVDGIYVNSDNSNTPTQPGTNNTGGTPNSGGTTNTSLVTTASKLADLKITKITKKANIRYVFVKNIGKAVAGKNTLGVYIGKKLIKKVSVKSIGIGKTLRVKVVIPKKFMTKKHINKFKTFKVDIRNVVKESNKKNNSFKAK